MPGSMPGIHVLRPQLQEYKFVDGRDKPGHQRQFSRRYMPRSLASWS
jgi:hypothetical protein